MTNTKKLSLADATNEAIRLAMRENDNVVCWGEDIRGGRGTELPETDDAWPRDMPTYAGLAAEFGAARVRDMPIAETGFIGAAFGAAAIGLRPVVDLMFGDFIAVCLDQIVNQGAKAPYMNGNQTKSPVVIRTAFGAGRQLGGQHSGVPYSVLAHYPGVKVVAPSTPADAKGLMRAAIRDDSLVVFCDHRTLSPRKGDVPTDDYEVPIGKAVLRRDGSDILLIGVSRTVQVCQQAADALAAHDVAVSVLDLRSLSPLDEEAIVSNASRCHRVIIVDDDGPRCSISADVAALIGKGCFGDLSAPVERITAPHAPVPFSPPLEDAYLPHHDEVVRLALRMTGH